MPPTTGRSASGPGAQVRLHLLELLRPVVAEAGYDLDDVSVTSAGRRSLVRVTVDADGGIDLDAVATVSRVVSDAMDADGGGAFAGPYVLEVSSPGVDRPLTEARHWRRAQGRLVTVDVGEAALSGRVVEVSDAGVTLQTEAGREAVPWSQLGQGRVQVEFNPPGAGAEADPDEGED